MIQIVDKQTHKILQPGSLYNNERITHLFIDSQTEEVNIQTQSGRITNIKDSTYVLPEIKDKLFKYDYFVSHDNELVLATCDSICKFNYDLKSRILGNKLFNPDLNLIYNSTKKYYYDKFNPNTSIVLHESDMTFIATFGHEKVYLYLQFEFFSNRHVKPIATLSSNGIILFNEQLLSQQGILSEFDKPESFVDVKKKAVALELLHIMLPMLPDSLFELKIHPTKLIEYLKLYKGYFQIQPIAPNLKLKSKFNKQSNQIMLIKTKFPQIIKSFDATIEPFVISEQILKD